MYKRWRVYSTFLTGIAIGLLYALLIGNPPPPDATVFVEWPVLVLSFSGVLGGIIYAIVVNGEVEMPRFVVDRSGVFKAGLFGDILLGIAGAFILELLLPPDLSVIDPTAEIEGSAIAATGIIGGYGGRAIIKFSLERFFKYTGTLDEFRANVITQRQAEPQSQRQSSRTATESAAELGAEAAVADAHTTALIEQIDRYVQSGLSEGDRTKLIRQLQAEPDSVRQAVFLALVELREEISKGLSNEQLERMAGLFDNLITVSPDEHPLYYQLALTRTALTEPAYAEALTALDKAIALRGPLDVNKPWQYELHRAVVNIEQAQVASEDFTLSASAQEAILADLETIAQVYNLETILKAADEQQIPRPVVNWIRHNSELIEERETLQPLLPAVRSVIVGSPLRPIGGETIGRSPEALSTSPVSGSASTTVDGQPSNSASDSAAKTQPSPNAIFPEIFSALGRCYDILSLDPFNILGNESAKATQVFDFYEAYPELDEGETVLVPKGVRYISGSRGQMEVSSQSELLYTESDIQKMFASTLGAALTKVMGAILPFSLSASYGSYKRDRKLNKNIYAFTKAEYIHYSLLLDRQQSSALHLNETFRQAVAQLPLTSNYEYLNFIDNFGTHTAIKVEFGGLFHHRYCLNKSSHASMVQAGGNVSIEAKRAFDAKFGKKSQGSRFQEFSYSSDVYDFCGGMKKENIHDWFATIKADPAPIHLELMPLYELLDSRSFPEDEQIIKKRSLLELATRTYLEKNPPEGIPWELWPSAIVGSNSGEIFSDIKTEPMALATNEDRYKQARIKEVRVWIKDWIEGVQIVLEGDQPPFHVHGSEDGDLKTLKLDPDDYITAVSVRAPTTARRLGGSDTYIGSIRMHTHKQKIWTVGKYDPRAIALDIPDGYQVIGFQGRSDKRIEKLGVISIPVAPQ